MCHAEKEIEEGLGVIQSQIGRSFLLSACQEMTNFTSFRTISMTRNRGHRTLQMCFGIRQSPRDSEQCRERQRVSIIDAFTIDGVG